MSTRNRRSFNRLAGITLGSVFDDEDAAAAYYPVDDYGAASQSWSPTDGVYADSPGLTATYWTDALSRFGEKFLTLKQMKDINDANLERAKRGLQPLDAAAYAPRVNVGIPPQTEQTVKYIAWAALGLGALYIFTQMKR